TPLLGNARRGSLIAPFACSIFRHALRRMPEESEVTIPPRAAALWRNRRFMRLFWAHAISLFGASLTAVALGLLAHDLVGANVSEVLGVTLTIRIAVVVLLAPFAGALAGWAGAKPTLLAADLFRAAIVLGFFLAETVWQIYLLAFLLNIASAIFTPVYKATIPNVVDPRQYPRALSFGTVAYDLANIAGPACSGFLIYWFGYRGNFIAHSVAFLISAVLILFIRFPARATLRPAGRSAERLPGVKAIFQRPPLLHAL